ncbi:MAG: TonB-dependent receptor [Alphaproteobacteria bacterium]|nr:TonB-dependent receptor [Alphaproteobacteria bacterium]MDE2014369.1 TonB-dependent receptor [Alphaproteobacteria bacterium]MDE2074660.1 TonB-dependent receptor [Alphaproteobacteria bacterium]MDE2350967.1 TonB-dependent receptor [Alphaproteobacteria bacterium]
MTIKKHKPGRALLGTSALIWFASCTLAQAQADSAGIESVVVTAEKRAENIQDVPISMVALSGDAMTRAGVSTLDGLQHYAPGLTISNVGNGFVSYTYLRGSGTNQIDAGSDPSVAYFIDEVYIGGTAGLQFDLLDVDRVEVLKGPQGTLFGRNASAGAISITTKRPEKAFATGFDATIGNYGEYVARGSVTGPISENLLYRFSAGYKRGDGYTDNLAGGPRPGRVSSFGARGQLEWVGDRATFLLTLDGLTARDGMTNQFISTANKFGLLSPAAISALPSGENFYKHYYNANGYEDQDLFGVTGRLEWNTPIGALTSISAFRTNRFSRLQDQDGTIAASYVLGSNERDNTFSQEIRLASDGQSALRWLGGLYYYHGRITDQFTVGAGPDFPTAIVQNTTALDFSTITTDSYAAFGQISYDITDQISITAGGRYTEDDKSDSRSVKGFLASVPFLVNPSAKWHAFNPSATLNYKVAPDVLTYFSYRQGFKSGGFQTLLPATPLIASTPFAPEKVNSYELGLKSTWFDNHMILNAALFRSDITDQQILRIMGPGVQTIDNAGATQADGLDLSVEARPIPELHLRADMTFQHAQFQRYQNGAISYAGRRQLRSPDFSGSYSADYNFALGGGANFAVRGEYTYTSNSYFDAANSATPGLFQPGYGLGNLFLTYLPAAGNWELAAWVKNVGDTRYYRNIAVAGPTGLAVPGDPLTFGVSFHINTEQ